MSRTDLTFEQALEACSKFKRKPLFFNGCEFTGITDYTECSEEIARLLSSDPRTVVIFSVGRGVRPSEIVVQERRQPQVETCGYCRFKYTEADVSAGDWPRCPSCGGC